MGKSDRGEEPAYPSIETATMDEERDVLTLHGAGGMTIRERMACQQMAGLLACSAGIPYAEAAARAVRAADALLLELAK